MNVQIKRSTSIIELSKIAKDLYPSAVILVDGPWVIIDIHEKTKYIIWLKGNNKFEVGPQKAIWNRTFEMKAKAQEIALQIADFFENGTVNQDVGNLVPTSCPHCKSPNEKKTLICEWCGGKVM
jgi:hypothetical protein